MRRLVVAGRITGPHKESHPSVRRIVQVRSEDGTSVLQGRYLMTGNLYELRAATTVVLTTMMHQIAEMRGERWGK